MNIILIATECFPFARVTTLGNIVSLLAKDIEKKGHNVKIFIPRYGSIDPSALYIERIPLELRVTFGDSVISSSVFKGILPDSMVSVFFIESQSHFSNSKEIYLPNSHEKEAQSRNSFFCSASLDVISKLKLSTDVIHFFNPECSKISGLIRSRNIEYTHLTKSKLVFTIQNIEKLTSKDIISATAEAISNSDHITTPSQAFTEELLLDVHNTEISSSLIKHKEKFSGIPGDIDKTLYNSENDGDIVQTFSSNYFSAGKKKCREDLLNQLKFEADHQVPIFCTSTKFSDDSQIQILIDALPEIAELNLKLILFTKTPEISRNYKNVKIVSSYDHSVMKRIYAGCEFVLCPDQRQPDGTSVLTAMTYGCIPVAFNSGAVKEIITDLDSSEESNGITFNKYTKESLFEAIIRATKYYRNKEKWAKLVKEAMTFDTKKLNPTKNYINIYENLLNAKKSQEASLSK